ncbi:sensor histidine kinase [Pontibacter akesuensis]|uniref:histidine kinase n=1 Tax=Pontibacter akesuensis TaxID=388950 RepID=A0A1I7KV99_9BACT|nr:PAS domain-containing sensor histidine kinase [Pontibacter akesuensis]GHA78214.1 histidine kinase [Pontibacter akesuensis]SFV01393.1 PAS/PAC sensor hybrid histidine kinase [Pontibacter akesuensis]
MNGENTILNSASELLSENTDLYRLLVEGVHEYAIFLISPTGYVQTWNAGAEKIKGYRPEEIIGQHFSKFYPQEALDDSYPEKELEWATRHGRFEDEGWRVKKDGSMFWANVILTAIYSSNSKELIGFSKITRDLTDRKLLEDKLSKAMEELKESEESARLLTEGVKDYAIFMLTPEGNIATWNRGAEHIKGYTADEIIGQHFSVFYTDEARERRFPEYELKMAIEQGRFEDEGWRLRKDGTQIWVNVVITPVYNAEAKHLGFTKVTRDLSERRKNEELMHKNRELHKINTDLDNFVYTVSHDLKAPIANLEGLIAMLKMDLGADASKHAEVLGRIDNSVVRLNNIILDLTDISRVQNEESPVEKVNLEELLQEVTGSLEDLIASYHAVIQPDFSGFRYMSYSRKNLRSILFNLLSNAIKYSSPERQPIIQIKTEKLHEQGQYLLTVADNGLGIHIKHTYKIFSMFKRMHTHVEGTGLGLYLVKRILENSEDRVEVESEVGKGSTFKLYFHQNEES